jgi:hypothetical protein
MTQMPRARKLSAALQATYAAYLTLPDDVRRRASVTLRTDGTVSLVVPISLSSEAVDDCVLCRWTDTDRDTFEMPEPGWSAFVDGLYRALSQGGWEPVPAADLRDALDEAL